MFNHDRNFKVWIAPCERIRFRFLTLRSQL